MVLVRWILQFLCLLIHHSILAQAERSAFSATGRGGIATTFVTDYQCIGINPANLGFTKSFRDPKITASVLESSLSFYSGALSRRDILGVVFGKASRQQFNYSEKTQASQRFAEKDNSLNADLMLLGFSIRLPKRRLGSFAFSLQDGIRLYLRLNRTASEIAFLGSNAPYFPYVQRGDRFNYLQNPRNPDAKDNFYAVNGLSEEDQVAVFRGSFLDSAQAKRYGEILNNSRISCSWFREYNISYGLPLISSYNFTLLGGVGFRYLSGIVYIDLAAENNRLTRNSLSISQSYGFSLEEASDGRATAPKLRVPSTNLFERFLFPKPVGRGFGFDFGFTAIVKRNLYIGAALTNFGKIVWEGNLVQVTDGKLIEFQGTGFNNYNFFGADQGALQFAGDKSPLKWTGGVSREVIELPSTFRVGASYEYYKTIHAGIDLIIPRNNVAGNLTRTLYGIGLDVRPFKMFRISAGANFGGNNGDKINFPAGFTYLSRKGFYEAGIATRDLITYIVDLGTGSTLSASGGFLRFKF
ncbi:MAG: DUF5723 family protein [Cytophagales bacterium]|nr:DUF5723 family protein [Cytophagales bacterium]MDW8384332.1 DUF5723 family protein [Flammeovirgaceae bacterium]